MAFGNLEDKNRFKMTHENERTNELNTERTECHRFSSNALARWNIGTQKKNTKRVGLTATKLSLTSAVSKCLLTLTIIS